MQRRLSVLSGVSVVMLAAVLGQPVEAAEVVHDDTGDIIGVTAVDAWIAEGARSCDR